LISHNYPELARLHREAVQLCHNTGCPISNFSLATDFEDVRRETSLALRVLNGARMIANKAGVLGNVYELTLPAIQACEALWNELTDEIHAELGRTG